VIGQNILSGGKIIAHGCKKILDANSVAVVKSRNIKMKGKVLEDHIKRIDQRISVLNCLRDVQVTPALKAADQIPDEKNK
jgi:hypothetical protein